MSYCIIGKEHAVLKSLAWDRISLAKDWKVDVFEEFLNSCGMFFSPADFFH